MGTVGLLVGGLYYGTSCFQLVRVSLSKCIRAWDEYLTFAMPCTHAELQISDWAGCKLVPDLSDSGAAAASDLELDNKPRFLLHVRLQPKCIPVSPIQCAKS